MIELLNENAGAVTGLATVALLIVTGFYAWTTHLLFKEARQTRLSGGEPRVVAFMRVNEVHPSIAQVHIANLSGAAAIGVTAKMEKLTEWPSKFYLEDSKILRDLSVMRPHEVLMFDVGVGPELFHEDEAARFRVTIDYKALDGRSYQFDNELKVESIEGHSRFRIYNMDDVARRLDEISKSLKKIISSNRVQVQTFNSEDRRAEKLAQEEDMRRWRKEREAEDKATADPKPSPEPQTLIEGAARIARKAKKRLQRRRPDD